MKGTNDDIEYSALDGTPRPNFLHRARLNQRVSRTLVVLGSLLFLSIIFATLSSNNPHSSSAARDSQKAGALDTSHFEYLSAPLEDVESSTTDQGTAFIVGEHHLVDGKYPKNYTWIDSYAREPFVEVMYENGLTNSAIARMPAGSPYDVMVVARGRNDKYKDPRESVAYVNLTIVGFFANFNPTSKQWERAGPEPYVLDLPVWRQYPRPCDNLVNGGPADPRLIWSDAGEPLAVIGTASRVPGVCKAVGMVDLRAVWPDLKQHMDELGYGSIPIKFDAFTEIGKASKKEKYEKNWAPFFTGPKPAQRQLTWRSLMLGTRSLPMQDALPETAWPLFAAQVLPRTILEVDTKLDTSERSPDSYVLAKEVDLSLSNDNTSDVASSQCLVDSLPSNWELKNLHQATPFYRVTMCARGTCTPSTKNTVLLGLIHYKIGWFSYRRMFVTMSTEAPFKILSVSPPLHFGSVKADDEVVFSTSMAFFASNNAQDGATSSEQAPYWKESKNTPGGYLNHGWLDDVIVVGGGVRDEQYNSVHLDMATALRGHTICP